jgi:hypothetical protein
MKKNIIFALLIGLLMMPSISFAQTPTATPTDSDANIDPNIKSLKDKIATKVAELRKDQEKVVTGNIDKIDKDTITVTYNNQPLNVTIDDTVTKIYNVSSGKKEIERDDLQEGDYLILKGIIIDNTITANTIYQDSEYLVTSGHINEIDTSAGTIKMVTINKDNYTLEIGKNTKQQMLDIKTFALISSTLAKIKDGDTIHIVAKMPKDKKSTTLTPDKILTIPQEYFISPTTTK